MIKKIVVFIFMIIMLAACGNLVPTIGSKKIEVFRLHSDIDTVQSMYGTDGNHGNRVTVTFLDYGDDKYKITVLTNGEVTYNQVKILDNANSYVLMDKIIRQELNKLP